MKTWIKLYTKVINDPDIGNLSFADRGVWMMLLALAGQLDHRNESDAETGELDTLARIAWYLRCPLGDLESAIRTFAGLGMIEEREGVWFIPKYPNRQASPASDRNEAVRERVRQHRAKSPPLPAAVTPLRPECNEPVTHLDTDTDIEKEVEVERERERDDNALRAATPTPLSVFSDLTHHCPESGTPIWNALFRLPCDAKSVNRWQTVVEEWILRGFKKNNIAGMLDWFKNGIPPRGPQSQAKHNQPRAPNPDLMEAARRSEAYQRQLHPELFPEEETDGPRRT